MGLKTPRQVAQDLGIARTTVYKWCRELGFRTLENGHYVLTEWEIAQIKYRPDRRRMEWKAFTSGTGTQPK